MAAAFTITSDNFYQISRMEELRRAYSERHYAVYGKFQRYVCVDGVYQWVDGDGSEEDMLQSNKPVIAGVERGQNQLQTVFFRKMQDFFLTRKPDRFDYGFENVLRHQAEQDPFFEDPRAFFQFVGGALYESDEVYGFRRSSREEHGVHVVERCQIVAVPDAPLDRWSITGLVAAGDYFGLWLIEDLLACFSAVRSTRVFYERTDSGLRWGLHNCGVYITVPEWYERQREWQFVASRYEKRNSQSCTQSLSILEYNDHVANGTLPAGDWDYISPGSGDWIRATEPTNQGRYVNWSSATVPHIGYPDPWHEYFDSDLLKPPWEPRLIPDGYWVTVPVGSYQWITTVDRSGSGYPARHPADTKSTQYEIYRRCSFTPNLTSVNAPAVVLVAVYKEIFSWNIGSGDPVSDGVVFRDSDHQIGDVIPLLPDRDQSTTVPYFVAEWDFSNSGIQSA